MFFILVLYHDVLYYDVLCFNLCDLVMMSLWGYIKSAIYHKRDILKARKF